MSALDVERLLNLVMRLRKLAFDQHPFSGGALTMPQLTLLEWVAASPGCGIREIATGLDLTAPTVSVSVGRLEEAGLLERQPDPQDRRAIQLFLTAQGEIAHEKMRTFRQKKMGGLLAELTLEERAMLLRLLERAISAAEAKQDQTP